MPKPFFIARPSGLFVRFLVPADLRQRLGVRYFVRRLYAPKGDHARLAAAHLGAALSVAFTQLRESTMADFDFKDILDKARRGQLRDLTVHNVTFLDGTHIGSAEINTTEDAVLFQAMRNAPAAATPSTATATATTPAQAPPTASAPTPALTVTNAPPIHLLSKTIDDYRAKRKVAKLTGDVDVNNTLRIFIEMIGDKTLANITDDDILTFEKATNNWPCNARKERRYRDLTSPEIVRDSQERQKIRDETLKLLSDNACRKHRDTLAAFFNWAVTKKKLSASPMSGDLRQRNHRIERRQVRRPYRAAELARIFNPETFGPWTEGYPHYFWAPWIALHTGARLNEVAQIYLDDIQTFHKITGFAIGAFRADQKVKTGSSIRFIPFAKPLLAAGLMTYVEEVRAAGHYRLFPHLKYGDDYGDYLGDRFIVYLRSIGLKVDENPDAPGMGFHWFRNTVGHAVVNITNSTLHTAASITGHSNGSIMPGELATYVQPAELRQKFNAVNKLKLPMPPIYVPGTYADALKAVHELSAKRARDDAERAKRAAEAALGTPTPK